ncbi:MAG TPA: HAMP domain-containing sensor histidine kinase [Candidatus Saccharimonadales bacterium]
MAISVLFSAVVYRIGANDIARGVHAQYERIYNQFPVFDNNPVLKTGSSINSSDHDLLLKLVFLNIAVLLLAGLASYVLARRTLEPIEEAHEQQKLFTANVSHELRTPLTALKMESEVALLNPNISAKELKNTLKSNLEEVSKLERLINNILRLTKLEADELRQNFGVVSSKQVVEDAIKQVKIQAKNRNINIEQNIHDQTFSGDEDNVNQLIVILLDNAIKYSSPNSLVKIETHKHENNLIFKITDHGVGIPKSSLEHIFDRFYRSEGSRNKGQNEREGYGLGLSIAKMIADVHSAVITVSSEVGKGTEVEVSFPLAG